MLGALVLLAAVQAQILPPVPPLTDWEGLPLLSSIRVNGLVPEDTLAITEVIDEYPVCRSIVGPMPSPRGEPNIRVVGFYLEVIALVKPDGRYAGIVTAPGPCDPVRAYARALVNGRFTVVAGPLEGPHPAWYRVRFNFSWQQ